MDEDHLGPIRASSGCVTAITIILCVLMICVTSAV